MLISGPAGTGKSVGCMLRLYHDAITIPNLRGLICRKTRASITESALVTWERDILGLDHPAIGRVARESRKAYRFDNGSEIVVGGMDNSSAGNARKIMSTDFDRIYVQEAIDLAESEWEALTTRLGRRGDFGMLLADTNPDKPSHWLKRRCDAGRTRMLESRHEDNPVLWDSAAKCWTPAGTAYLDKLDKLTGPRKMRLRHGRWVQAEGVVYEGWDAAVHIVPRFTPSNAWTRYLSIDFGFTNPFVCQWWARDPDGRLFMYREIYRTQRLVEDHARQIKALCAADCANGSPRPLAVICDTDAEDRATFSRHFGVATTGASKNVSAGIQAVAARLRPAGDGKPRLFVMRDVLVERDQALYDAKLPTCFVEEVDGYCWDVKEGKKKGEQPVKENDHACDSARYLVANIDSIAGARVDSVGHGAFGVKRQGIGGIAVR